MRKYSYICWLAGWSSLAASCYEDKSTLQTTEISTRRNRGSGVHRLTTPVVHNPGSMCVEGIRITKMERRNPKDLAYEWFARQDRNDSNPDFARHDAGVPRSDRPADLSAGYLFLLTVTDTTNDPSPQCRWKLFGRPSNEGLGSFTPRTETTSDLALVMHRQRPKLMQLPPGRAQSKAT